MCFDTDITGSDPLGQGLIWPFSSWGATSSDILTIAMHTKVDKSLLRFLETRMNEELSKQTLQVRAPVVIRIHRCIGTISENTCEYFNSFIWTTAVCQFLKAKGVFWTPMKEALHPTFECPIKKGHYEVINSTTNVDQMGEILGASLEKFVWKGVLELFNERSEMGVCILIHSEFRRILVRHR
ncbi:uncharacterized protein LOC117643633 isoform X3 [Thrips palmi]|uniref:Uncharacterized protein LOC117643633 isoform X3 n=1 Tax=Thrips palmi TaxID=161013 RepID=A0A6P8YFM1_THRPL|nr:uncharacterized protein LOC117643633 isoform X3 [Thrips palmi]